MWASCNYTCVIYIKAGRNNIELVDYLNNYPLIFSTTDDKMITGVEITVGNPDAISFSAENIKVIDWEFYNTHISLVIESKEFGSNSIQKTLR